MAIRAFGQSQYSGVIACSVAKAVARRATMWGSRDQNHLILNQFSGGKYRERALKFLAISRFGHSLNTQIGLIATDDQNFLHSCTNSCTKIEFPIAQYRNRAQT
jgi:hypothetical protein